MKIAILTLPLNNNIGGILQAYALRNVLLSMGHEVVHIEHKNSLSVVHQSSSKFYSWWYTRRWVEQLVFRDSELKKHHKATYNLRMSTSGIRDFVTKHVPLKILKDWKNYQAENFDCIVIGSDQIWRPPYFPRIENAYLAFAATDTKLRKVAYAASFGVDHWEYSEEQTKRCGDLLRQFFAVSVREDSGVRLCKEQFGVDPKHLPDPTLLLDHTKYMELAGVTDADNHSEQALVSYILDRTEDKMMVVSRICQEKGYVHVAAKRDEPSVEGWLTDFMKASFVVTDSFHGCVFAILFRKPFIAYGNKTRGLGRFQSLFKKFGLENRLVLGASEIDAIKNEPINWQTVDLRLAQERRLATDFLQMALAE